MPQEREIPFCLPVNYPRCAKYIKIVLIQDLSFADILETEVPQLSCADNNLTTEEHEESGKEVCKPNLAAIPEGKQMFKLCQMYTYIYSIIFCV